MVLAGPPTGGEHGRRVVDDALLIPRILAILHKQVLADVEAQQVMSATWQVQLSHCIDASRLLPR